MSQENPILVLLPAALSEGERLLAMQQAQERYPNSRIVVWDEREPAQRRLGYLLHLRRQHVRHCLIGRGAASLGYGQAKWVAACMGAPTFFEGKEWSSADLWHDLFGLAAYHLRVHWCRLLCRLIDLLFRVGSLFRRRHAPEEWQLNQKRAETALYLKRYETLFDGRTGCFLDVHDGVSLQSDVAQRMGWRTQERDVRSLLEEGESVAPGQFDLVFALDLYRLRPPHWRVLLNLLHLACQPGGVVLLRSPVGRSTKRKRFGREGEDAAVCPTWLREEATRAGFQIHHSECVLDKDLAEVWLVAAP